MTKEKLERLWEQVKYNGVGELEYQLVSTESKPSLNIGFTKDNKRVFVLELPRNFENGFKTHERENLILKYYSGEKCLCVVLNDDYFSGLFNDLIISIFGNIALVENPNDYTKAFVQLFNKWSAFFQQQHNEQLDLEKIKGLFGELSFLKELIISNQSKINNVLESWRGPYDEGRDFVLDNIDYEIKTIESGKAKIKVSSEYQLMNTIGKNLYLVVISVFSNPENGKSLHKLINEIREKIILFQGDLTIFYSALRQKSISPNDLSKYDKFTFLPDSLVQYHCREGFPSITCDNIPNGVEKVKYVIRLHALTDFVSQEKSFKTN